MQHNLTSLQKLDRLYHEDSLEAYEKQWQETAKTHQARISRFHRCLRAAVQLRKNSFVRWFTAPCVSASKYSTIGHLLHGTHYEA